MSKGYREKCLAQKINVCNVCGSQESLVVHHINGDRNDNQLENLVPLCEDCHHEIHAAKDLSGLLKEYKDKLPDSSIRNSDDGMADPVQLRIESDTRDQLRALKTGNQTYDDVIIDLLAAGDRRLAQAEPKTLPNDNNE